MRCQIFSLSRGHIKHRAFFPNCRQNSVESKAHPVWEFLFLNMYIVIRRKFATSNCSLRHKRCLLYRQILEPETKSNNRLHNKRCYIQEPEPRESIREYKCFFINIIFHVSKNIVKLMSHCIR